MAMSFDGPGRRIVLSPGTTEFNVRDGLSRWADWVNTSDNSKYLPAYESTGGDIIDPAAGTTVPFYAFLINGWRIQPQESDHTLKVTGGVLLVQGGGDPFLEPVGDWTVRVNYQQPVQAIVVAVGGSAGGATAAEIAAAVRNELLVELGKITSIDKNASLIPALL